VFGRLSTTQNSFTDWPAMQIEFTENELARGIYIQGNINPASKQLKKTIG
jgi:hypothetical protein